MKKEWKPVAWEDIRPGDVVRWKGHFLGKHSWSAGEEVEHIGLRYAKMVNGPKGFKNLWRKNKENFTGMLHQYERLEEVWPDVGIYVLVKKIGGDMFSFIGKKVGTDVRSISGVAGYGSYIGRWNDFKVLATIWEGDA
jgi:hypothetical protein